MKEFSTGALGAVRKPLTRESTQLRDALRRYGDGTPRTAQLSRAVDEIMFDLRTNGREQTPMSRHDGPVSPLRNLADAAAQSGVERLGQLVGAIRRWRALSLETVDERTGLAGACEHIENDELRRSPRLSTMMALARAFDVSVGPFAEWCTLPTGTPLPNLLRADDPHLAGDRGSDLRWRRPSTAALAAHVFRECNSRSLSLQQLADRSGLPVAWLRGIERSLAGDITLATCTRLAIGLAGDRGHGGAAELAGNLARVCAGEPAPKSSDRGHGLRFHSAVLPGIEGLANAVSERCGAPRDDRAAAYSNGPMSRPSRAASPTLTKEPTLAELVTLSRAIDLSAAQLACAYLGPVDSRRAAPFNQVADGGPRAMGRALRAIRSDLGFRADDVGRVLSRTGGWLGGYERGAIFAPLLATIIRITFVLAQDDDEHAPLLAFVVGIYAGELVENVRWRPSTPTGELRELPWRNWPYPDGRRER